MAEDTPIFRSKEQVLYDLSMALHFSPESLESNRNGRLSTEQRKRLSGRCFTPMLLLLLFAVGPFIVWTYITAGRHQLPFANAFPALLTELAHVQDLFEAHGKMGGVIMLGSILIPLGLAAFMAFRIPVALYFDLLDRRVDSREGRVVAREETTNRPNGRDPIEKYSFSLRHLNMPVNLTAYRALESGSIYIVYLTHRSEILLSMEPKMQEPPMAVRSSGTLHGDTQAASPSERAV